MDKIPLITLVFYSFPESFLIFSFGVIIQRKVFQFAPIVLAAIISVLASYIARLLPLPYGVHTLLGVLTVFLLFFKVLRLDVKQSMFSALMSLGILVALENIVLNLIQFEFNLNLKDLMTLSPWERTLIGWPHLSVWSILTLYMHTKYKSEKLVT